MSRYIRVCTTVNYPSSMPSFKSTSVTIAEMKEYWTRKLEPAFFDSPDIVLLPEYCDIPAGFKSTEERVRYNRDKEEEMLNHFKGLAQKNSCYIGYCTERTFNNDYFYNSIQLIDRFGKVIGVYNKSFPTIDEMNKKNILPGAGAKIVNCDFGRVGFAVCWDLNFSELRQEYAAKSPEIILFPSMFHGGFKASLWAYECQSYFIGAIGGNGQRSYVLDPLGNQLVSTNEYHDIAVLDINLDYSIVQNSMNSKKLRDAKEKYGNKIKIFIPQGTGAVMLTSEVEGLKSEDVVREFGMETFDDLMERTREIRKSLMPQQ